MKKCFECEKQAEYEHHVVPKVLGGEKTLPLCAEHHGLIHDLSFTNHKNLVSKGMINKKNNKKSYCKNPPYGFKKENGNLIEDVNEQLIISKIKTLKQLGNSTLGIAKILTKQGYLSRDGTSFSQATVYRILNNTENETKNV